LRGSLGNLNIINETWHMIADGLIHLWCRHGKLYFFLAMKTFFGFGFISQFYQEYVNYSCIFLFYVFSCIYYLCLRINVIFIILCFEFLIAIVFCLSLSVGIVVYWHFLLIIICFKKYLSKLRPLTVKLKQKL
jgi:hypothetical protein